MYLSSQSLRTQGAACLGLAAISLLVFTGCQNNAEQQATPQAAEAPAAPKAAPQQNDRAIPCENPELWLARYSLDEIAEPYCAACADRGEICMDGELQWELNGAPAQWNLPAIEYEYAIEAIRAWHGQPLTDASWAPYMKAQSWNKGVEKQALSKVAAANTKVLQTALAKRNKEEGRVEAKDRALIAEWFGKFKSGDVHVNDLAAWGVDGEIVMPSQFMDFIKQGNDDFSRRTPIYLDTKGSADWMAEELETSGRKFAGRTLSVDRAAVGKISCTSLGEDCEGGEMITFYIDTKGKVIAVHATHHG